MDKEDIGLKALNIASIAGLGLSIPKSLVLDADIVFNLKKDESQLFDVAKNIFNQLNKPLVARGSANFEDTVLFSFAGQYESFIDINTLDDLIKALKICFNAIDSDRVAYYCERNNFDAKKIRLAIIVQEMIKTSYSGVLFTKNPVTNNEQIVIEFTKGLGVDVVSGTNIPETILIEKSNFYDVKCSIPHINLKQLVEGALKIEQEFNCPQDIEWGATDNSDIIYFQARPITTTSIKTNCNFDTRNKKIIAVGVPTSVGFAEGRTCIINNKDDFKNIAEGDIVVSDYLDIDILPHMKDIKGLITKFGGILSHIAILAREFNTPFITQVQPNNFEVFPNFIAINGYNGEIYSN